MVERSSMYLARFEKAENVGDDVRILGEKVFDDEEEERKELEELQMVAELTNSINSLQQDITERVH